MKLSMSEEVQVFLRGILLNIARSNTKPLRKKLSRLADKFNRGDNVDLKVDELKSVGSIVSLVIEKLEEVQSREGLTDEQKEVTNARLTLCSKSLEVITDGINRTN